ncbi:FAD-dependent oxidoreductase [Microbacterium schleiferi]|uniref:FAD-dependent oxidoreductase n=1 Tax=Microbacterium schleiferi TaxID=69362 RepID=A0A7S8MW36_9MICO|nr:FAD-dependent oxidoreductase [Microbacterium schleiferi]QPE04364.1 FAD-dependent oxidoreductase [Microbacterium schleiferi]
MAESAFEKLVAHARSEHVVVVGGGISGLVAALDCAKIGMRVTVLEASDRLGGAVAAAEVAGCEVALGATGWSTRGGAVDELVDELGLAGEVVEPVTTDVWVSTPTGVLPFPPETVAGIPANPWDPTVRRIIGWGGTWRAYLDRLRPPLTIGQEHDFGALVRRRMGTAVHQRLVAPLTRGRYGLDPSAVDVSAIAPGLSSALTRTGSLAGAAGELSAAAAESDEPPIRGLAGGMTRLVDTLAARLRDYDVTVRTAARVSGLAAAGDTWTVTVDADEDAGELSADAVILATGAAEAARLAPLSVPEMLTRELVQDVVTLVASAPPAEEPRTTVFAVDSDTAPVVASDETARWGAAGSGVRIARVTYGDGDTAGPLAALSDDVACERAARDAEAMLGFPASEIVGARRDRWVQPPSAVLRGRDEAVETVRRRVERIRGLGLVGAWVAGPGLARVIARAREEAERLRVNLLWGVHADGVTLEPDHPLDKREETP